jgi:hypothetical protein
MSLQIAPVSAHPEGESAPELEAITETVMSGSLAVDTVGRRFHVEWDPLAPVTPLGQLVFFSQFLATSGLYAKWVAACPLRYASPNAPCVGDVLGTSMLAILSGASRYAHVTALRGDQVNPQGLAMEKVVSEDSLRRAFEEEDPKALAQWQTQALLETCAPALAQPWIADLDVTVKPIYGHQQGAEVGYNPHKPGRPSHAYHTVFLRTLRVALDVEVRSGKEHAAVHGLENLWRIWEGLTSAQRPWLICGDAGFGNERIMSQCQERGQPYLFRQRGTKGVKQLIQMLECQGGWQSVRDGWSGCEGQLQLTGWTRKRRAVVFRRLIERSIPSGGLALLEQGGVQVQSGPLYEYVVLVTSLKENLLTLLHLYQQRADVENAYDELKNQWGWGGFTTRDQLRCQVAARMVAQFYNWWNLFVRCADPARAREAISSRPLLLCSVGRLIKSGGQTTLRLTSTHAQAAQAQSLLTRLSLFLSGLNNTAEQLTSAERWRRIWQRILTPYLQPPAALLTDTG